MIKNALIILSLLFSLPLMGQTKVITTDLSNFYAALDSVHQLTNPEEQLEVVKALYLRRASDGLMNFIRLGGGWAEKWRFNMVHHYAYYQEIRPFCENLSEQIPEIESRLAAIKADFPGFREGRIYFIMGIGLTGGTPDYSTGNLLLCADNLAKKSKDWAIPSAIHEFIHIQQKRSNGDLLAQTISEGVAEFLSEWYFGKDLADHGFAPHLAFGRKREKAIWKSFQKDMFLVRSGYQGWLYDGLKKIKGHYQPDLGYFVGYRICQSYYKRAADKKQAIQDLLNLDLSSNETVLDFVQKSGYASGKDKKRWEGRSFAEKASGSPSKGEVYGYEIRGDKAVFAFRFPSGFLSRYHIPVVSASVAGSFNNWNPQAEGFSMRMDEPDRFYLELPLSRLPGDSPFKFVVNGDVWMPVPADAVNRDDDGNALFRKN